jgi:hypothetical protein
VPLKKIKSASYHLLGPLPPSTGSRPSAIESKINQAKMKKLAKLLTPLVDPLVVSNLKWLIRYRQVCRKSIRTLMPRIPYPIPSMHLNLYSNKAKKRKGEFL